MKHRLFLPVLLTLTLCLAWTGCGEQLHRSSISANVPIYAYGTLTVETRAATTLSPLAKSACLNLEPNQPPLDPWKVVVDSKPQIWYLFYDDTAHPLPLATTERGKCLHHLKTFYTLLHVNKRRITQEVDLSSQ